MYYEDLREWLEILDKAGKVKTVNGAAQDLEIGALTELYYSSRYADPAKDKPAMLFDNIPGFPAGHRVLTGSFNSLRMVALAMGEEHTERDKLLTGIRKKLREYKPVIKPIVATDGPVLENTEEGDDVNLEALPAPKWHERDGGRYIGTGCSVITKDPEEGWTNLGTYRIMVQNKNTLGLYISPGKHGALQREKWFAQGKPCPVSVVIGQDPLLFLFASKEMKYGESEYDFAGWIKGKPIEVLEGKNGLMIPARAEIVAEGYCYPGEEMEEGPFGEWTGYYSRPKQNTATIRVTRLLYRNNPIILGSPPSKPPNQVSLFNDILRSALVWDELDGAGIPGVQDVCCHEAGGARFFVAISIKQKYPGHAKQVAAVAAQCHAAAYMGRYIVVVDDDIDATSLEDVIWAMSTRSDPETDIDIMRHCWTGPLDPIMDEKGYSARALIEATIPFKRKGSFPFVAKISPELADKTIEKWGAVLNDKQT